MVGFVHRRKLHGTKKIVMVKVKVHLNDGLNISHEELIYLLQKNY